MNLIGYDMTLRRDRFVASWSPRMGRRAAELKWKAARTLLIAWLIGIVALGSMGAALKTRSAAVAAIDGVVWFVWVALEITALRLSGSMRRVICETLGIDRSQGVPPMPAAVYEAWCKRHGLVPYAAEAGCSTPTTAARSAELA